MAYFKDAQDVYDTLGKLFVDLADDDELGPKFRKADTIVRYEFRDPDSQITVRLQPDQPGDVDFGDSDMEPDVVMSMEADTAHKLPQESLRLGGASGRYRVPAGCTLLVDESAMVATQRSG